jgi:hypothetical protein
MLAIVDRGCAVVTHEMPARPTVGPGADAVDFPWDDAAAAVEALDAAVAELISQLDSRTSMREVITDWEGRHRDEHDDAYFGLVTRLWGLVGTLSFRAGAIVDGAAEAVSQQVRSNDAAAELAEQTAARAQARLAES